MELYIWSFGVYVVNVHVCSGLPKWSWKCVELMLPIGRVSVTGMGRTHLPTTKNLQCEKSACVLTTITVCYCAKTYPTLTVRVNFSWDYFKMPTYHIKPWTLCVLFNLLNIYTYNRTACKHNSWSSTLTLKKKYNCSAFLTY